MEILLWLPVMVILFGIWAIPISLSSTPLVVIATLFVWAAAWTIVKLTVGWPLPEDFIAPSFTLILIVPVLYAFTIGATTQLVARVFTPRDSDAEQRVRLMGLVMLAAGPIYLTFS